MIQPNELRIGNYVKYLGEIQQVVGIDYEHVYLDTISFDYIEHDEVESISLTPEIIENIDFPSLGFGLEAYFRYGDYGMFNIHGSGIIITYLHALQNFYFALTQQEIQIKNM